MKKILFFALSCLAAVSTILPAKAQNIASDKRVVITDTEGGVHAFATKDLARLSFDKVGDASVTISEVSKTSYSITVSLTRPADCARYQVAIWQASETVTEPSKYIADNYKKEGSASGMVELTSLNAATDYVVGVLAYDKYGIASAVTTLNITTSAQEQLAAPKAGDILYSDGTWSTKINHKKTPVAIVFNVGTSAKDSLNGWTHGYAMALKNCGKQLAWSTSEGNYQGGGSEYVSEDTSSVNIGYMRDLDGYSETQTLVSNTVYTFPAAQAAVAYSAAKPAGSSGWYLPSVGQWVKILVNLGGMTSVPSRYSTQNAYWDYCSRSFVSAINEHLDKLADDADVEKFDGEDIYYWSSTEYGSATAYEMHVNYEEDGIDVDSWIKTYGFSSCRVRAVIAF